MFTDQRESPPPTSCWRRSSTLRASSSRASRWLGEQADQRGGFLPDSDAERPISSEPLAWAVRLFGDENVLWAVSERVEHAAAGRLAHNVGASSVDHTEGKEWLRHMPSARSTRRPSSTAWRGCESRGAWPLA
jgi:hypothetical protein